MFIVDRTRKCPPTMEGSRLMKLTVTSSSNERRPGQMSIRTFVESSAVSPEIVRE